MKMDAVFSERLAKILEDAAGVADGLRQEADGFVKARLETLIRDMNAVPREEFEAVRAMAIKARAENAELRKRIEKLEKPRIFRKISPHLRKRRHFS